MRCSARDAAATADFFVRAVRSGHFVAARTKVAGGSAVAGRLRSLQPALAAGLVMRLDESNCAAFRLAAALAADRPRTPRCFAYPAHGHDVHLLVSCERNGPAVYAVRYVR